MSDDCGESVIVCAADNDMKGLNLEDGAFSGGVVACSGSVFPVEFVRICFKKPIQ